MAVVFFAITYAVTAAIYGIVMVFAVGDRARAFKAVSPGMLPPMGIFVALFVAFTAAQVWNDNDRASAAVSHEASALRAVVLLAASLPDEQQSRLRALIHRHIEDAVAREWPMMAKHTATLEIVPGPLAEALRLTLALTPGSEGQQTALRKIADALEEALDARRQRILISQSGVNFVKWSCLAVQAICALVAIAMVHSDSRLAATISMGLFATGVAASAVLIAAHDRPFVGELAVKPEPLLQVMPDSSAP
jgi:hypothetical protein